VGKRVRVYKDSLGFWWWQCRSEECERAAGATIHWEIAQHFADEHIREHHQPVRHIPRDVPTPPGGHHFDWSDTGMHLKVRDDE
jgi:hypothetical protein